MYYLRFKMSASFLPRCRFFSFCPMFIANIISAVLYEQTYTFKQQMLCVFSGSELSRLYTSSHLCELCSLPNRDRGMDSVGESLLHREMTLWKCCDRSEFESISPWNLKYGAGWYSSGSASIYFEFLQLLVGDHVRSTGMFNCPCAAIRKSLVATAATQPLMMPAQVARAALACTAESLDHLRA